MQSGYYSWGYRDTRTGYPRGAAAGRSREESRCLLQSSAYSYIIATIASFARALKRHDVSVHMRCGGVCRKTCICYHVRNCPVCRFQHSGVWCGGGLSVGSRRVRLWLGCARLSVLCALATYWRPYWGLVALQASHDELQQGRRQQGFNRSSI